MFRFPQAVLCAAILTAGTAAAVPTSDTRDPPVPPSGLGRLFGADIPNAIRNCSVTARTSSQATVGFTNTFPHAMVSFVDSGGNRTAWSSLPSGAADYDCTTVGGCFHATAEVHIRGCHNAGCAGDPVVSCSVNIGLPLNGPPDITWGGVETTQVLPIGCAEGAATSFVVRLRYAGTAPGTGYPTIGGMAATERTAERAVSGPVTEATYVATAGWSATDATNGYWDFTVALDSSGTRDASARIALGAYCLAAPTAQVVGSGSPPTLTPIAAGSTFKSGTELDVQSANSGMALTGQKLMYNSAAASFGRFTPPGAHGVDTPYAWYETAMGRDGLTYTSPELRLTAQPPPCKTGRSASWWLDGGNNQTVTLPQSTDWVSGPRVLTDACAPAVPAAPNKQWGYGSKVDFQFGAGDVASGWPTRVRAKQASGAVGGNAGMVWWFGKAGWNNARFQATRAPEACPSGQRRVSGSCEDCPTYDECSGGSLVTRTWCNAGSPPADDRRVNVQSCVGGTTVTTAQCVDAGDPDPVDAPCPITCPAGQRDGGGFCEPCPTYHVCSGSSRIVQTWCDDGSPPASATLATYQQCNSGTTVTLSACVAPGDTPPASTPCPTTCQAGERLVNGSCESCPTYTACTASTGTNRSSLTTTRTFCSPGNPPASAVTRWNIMCRGGNSEGRWQCIGEGGLSSDPGDVPCSGDRCIYFDGCATDIGWVQSSMTQRYYRCASNPVQPPAPQVFSRLECVYRDTPNEFERTNYYCVGTGGLANTGSIPADDACSTNCSDYRACTAQSSHGANRNITTKSTYCGTGSAPADAWTANRTYCNGGHNDTRTVCVGTGGFASDPGNQPCATCPSRQRMVNGACQPCPTHYVCNGNNRVREWWCGPGSPPADATTASFQSCVGGATVTTNTCVPPGGSAPADDPCAPTQGIETYCDANGVAQTRPSGSAQNVDNRDSAADCTSGETLNTDSCCVATAPPQTYQACNNGVVTTETWTGGGTPVDDPTASRHYCVGASYHTETICASSDRDERPNGCSSGFSLNSGGCCSSLPTYQACNNGVITTEYWTGGGTPVDDPTATRHYCVGASYRTATICASSDRDERPNSCSSGYHLNGNGCCEVNPPPETATETYCDANGNAQTRTIQGTQDVDNRDSAADCTSRQILNSQSCCVARGTETYCDGSGNKRTRPASGTQDVDNRPSSCPSGQILNSDRCCEAGGTETYCVGSDARTRPSGTSQDVDNRPSSCSSGQELNSDSCCEPCTQSIKPYCNRGQDWVWRNCRWEEERIDQPDCYNSVGVTYVHKNWSPTLCTYTSPTPTNDPQPSNDCGSGTWNEASCGWNPPPPLPDTSSCPAVGQAWGSTLDKASCTYDTVTRTKPAATLCGSATWDASSCDWNAPQTPPDEPTGCPGQGQAWGTLNTNTCSYGTVAVTAPTDCSGTLRWKTNCTWECVIKQCSSVSQPTSKSDCTEPVNIGILKVHGFRQKSDGWYWYRNSVSIPGGTVLPASEGLCIACEGSTQPDVVVNACEATPPTSCDIEPNPKPGYIASWQLPSLLDPIWSDSANGGRGAWLAEAIYLSVDDPHAEHSVCKVCD